MRKCKKCDITKPLEQFTAHKGCVGGRTYQCKECVKKYHAEYYRRNREEVRARTSKYYYENREQILEAERDAYHANLEESRAKHREWGRRQYRDNKERKIAAGKRWAAANIEKVRALVRKRRARRLNAEGTFSMEEWLALCEFYGNICLACGNKRPLTVDHVIPLSKGGSNSIENIQPLCHSCNSKKGTKSTDYRLDT